MSDPFVAEIRAVGFNFAPRGWATCNGQLLSISQNTALFSLVGTTYGGNGTSTFGLPNLQGSAVMHQGQGPGLSPHSIGEVGGQATVTLTQAQMPQHTHSLLAASAIGSSTSPSNAAFAVGANGTPMYTPASNVSGNMSAQALSTSGSGQAHNNRQPYLALNFVIALQGIFPARN